MNWITRIKKASERITTAIKRRATKSEIAASKYISCLLYTSDAADES